jgi:hypothetical protein
MAHSRQRPAVFLKRSSRPKLFPVPSNVWASMYSGPHTQVSTGAGSPWTLGVLMACSQTPGFNLRPVSVAVHLS